MEGTRPLTLGAERWGDLAHKTEKQTEDITSFAKRPHTCRIGTDESERKAILIQLPVHYGISDWPNKNKHQLLATRAHRLKEAGLHQSSRKRISVVRSFPEKIPRPLCSNLSCTRRPFPKGATYCWQMRAVLLRRGN